MSRTAVARWMLVALLALAAGAAQAQRHHGGWHRPPHHNNHWNNGWNNNWNNNHHWNNHWHNDWDNRRDAQRAGVVAGVVAGGVAGSAARNRADQRFAECMFATGYDWACDRRRFDDEMRARESARRTGVIAGVAAYSIVRN
ncbi:MAG TPA: hypothetical protein VGI11_13490 [Variovorax sp.]